MSAQLSRLPHLETRSYTLLEQGYLSQATIAGFTLAPVVKMEGENNLKIWKLQIEEHLKTKAFGARYRKALYDLTMTNPTHETSNEYKPCRS